MQNSGMQHLNHSWYKASLKTLFSWNQNLELGIVLAVGLPAGQLSFLLRTGTDFLPTPLNLRRWRYRISSSCPLCNSPNPTTAHILNSCQEALIQGRYTWRHDSILNCLVNSVKTDLTPSSKLYADIPSWRASDHPPTTLPPNISASTARPDVVLIEDSTISILELTVPSNTCEALLAAKQRKTNKPAYIQLISDLEDRSFSVSYATLEIASLGHYHQEAEISKTFNQSKRSSKQILQKLSRIAIACSYLIFNSRVCTSWDPNKPFFIQ